MELDERTSTQQERGWKKINFKSAINMYEFADEKADIKVTIKASLKADFYLQSHNSTFCQWKLSSSLEYCSEKKEMHSLYLHYFSYCIFKWKRNGNNIRCFRLISLIEVGLFSSLLLSNWNLEFDSFLRCLEMWAKLMRLKLNQPWAMYD